MPQSQKPRRKRGEPQYRRDLRAAQVQSVAPLVSNATDADPFVQRARADAAAGNPPAWMVRRDEMDEIYRAQRPKARLARAARGRGGLVLAGVGAGAVGGLTLRRRHRQKEKDVAKASLSTVFTPQNIERAGRMVAAAAGEAGKPAKGAPRARRVAQAATAAARTGPSRGTKLKVVGGGVAGTAGVGALFGMGSGLGHRATDKRVTAAKAFRVPTRLSLAKTPKARLRDVDRERLPGRPSFRVDRKGVASDERFHKADRDVMSGTAVRTVATPKGPDGKFVSHENDLKVFTPKFKSTRRAPRDSRVQVWRKGGDATSKPWVAKLDSGRSGLNPNRRGTRLA